MTGVEEAKVELRGFANYVRRRKGVNEKFADHIDIILMHVEDLETKLKLLPLTEDQKQWLKELEAK